MQEAQVSGVQLLKPGEDPAIVLDLVDEAFHQMALPVRCRYRCRHHQVCVGETPVACPCGSAMRGKESEADRNTMPIAQRRRVPGRPPAAAYREQGAAAKRPGRGGRIVPLFGQYVLSDARPHNRPTVRRILTKAGIGNRPALTTTSAASGCPRLGCWCNLTMPHAW